MSNARKLAVAGTVVLGLAAGWVLQPAAPRAAGEEAAATAEPGKKKKRERRAKKERKRRPRKKGRATPSAPPEASPSEAPPPESEPPASEPLAIPSSMPTGKGKYEGFGSHVTGGTGKKVVMVGSAGAFKSASGQSNVHIKFGFSGNIPFSGKGFGFAIKGKNITLDGFSAPSPGVTISRGVIIAGNRASEDDTGSNIIVQGLRFRKGYDSLAVRYNAHDVVIDHCTFSGAGDGCCDITEGAHDVTFSWNIITKTGGQGKAQLIKYGAYHISIHHNIYSMNNQRNPMIGTHTRGPAQKKKMKTPVLDMRHNIVWQWSSHGTSVGKDDVTGNVVSNLYYTKATGTRAANFLRTKGKVYVAGNVAIMDPRGAQYKNSHKVTHSNSMSNAGEFPAPKVSGPAPSDKAGRLAEWAKVKAGAGLRPKFPDDALESAARAAIKLPGQDVWGKPWNKQ